MKDKSSSEPPDKTATLPRLAQRMRRIVLIGSVIIVVLTGVGVARAEPQVTPAAVQTTSTPPGLTPAVQNWLKNRERFQIELNNALVPVVQNIDKPGGGRALFRRLTQAGRALSARGAAPMQRLDQLSRAGLDKFVQGAAACEAGDPTTAKQLITEGLAERAAQQEAFDEFLEGS